MASRDEAEAIRRGETPQVRAYEQNGQYIPWYENRGYDPYRDYYGGYGGRGALVRLTFPHDVQMEQTIVAAAVAAS